MADDTKGSKGSPTPSQPAWNPAEVDTVNEDRPLRIIDINEEGTHFTLIEPNLRAILNRAERINPKKISIVSVVGAFRMGKSFLLDFFLRYLRSNPDENSAPAMSTDQLPGWMVAGGDRLSEGADDSGAAPGFLWRPGKDRTTTGIWMYGKPFPRRDASGEIVPVVLMDTQGMFDFKTSSELTASIFGLSTLISSHQIYNLSKQIQEDKLQQLDYFTQFSMVALKEFSKAQSRSKKAQPALLHPFQTIDFLVRDWQNFQDDSDIKRCMDEMPVALEDALNSNIKDEGTRDAIKSAFEHIGIFLLPHPGLNMTKVQYKGGIAEIEKNFLALLDVYVHRVLGNALTAKKIQGREVSPRDLLQYVTAYSEVFKEGKLPKPMTLVSAISLTTNLCAKDAATALYKTVMKQACGGDAGCTDEELNKAHEDASRQALEHFDNSATFGDDAQIGSTRMALNQALADEYANFVEINKLKLQGRLAWFIVPLIIAVAALFLDTLSDYTCDAWSPVCRSMSNYLAFAYYLVFIAVLVEFYRIYSAKGSVAVGIGAMALGQATLTKANEITKSLSKQSALLLASAAKPPQSSASPAAARQKKQQ